MVRLSEIRGMVTREFTLKSHPRVNCAWASLQEGLGLGGADISQMRLWYIYMTADLRKLVFVNP